MKTGKIVATALFLVGAGVTALVACSSDTTSTPPTTTTNSATVTVHVTAAAGGTVSDPSGKATLAIPAGALAADTDITLATSAAANGSAGDVLDFGPDGLQFLKPATLTIKADGVTVPDGKSVSVAILGGTTWTPLTGSTFANGVATADVMHFTKYSIIIVDGKVVIQPPASCDAAQAGFTNCGGDVSGTWKFLDYCVDPKVADSLKPVGCSGATATIEVTNTQTITFSGGTSGTVTTSDGTATTTITTEVPTTCLSDGGVGVVCANLSDTKTTCTDSATQGNCHCVQTDVKAQTGNTTTFPDPANPSEYCVQGNLLTVRESKNGVATGNLFVLQKL
jgi:hypothetical protein